MVAKKRSELAEVLRQRFFSALHLGLLRPGSRLPSAREMAASMHVDRRVVLAAYRELEREGLLVVRQGLGTFVRTSLAPRDQAEQVELQQRLTDWVSAARRAGLVDEDIEAMYRAVMRLDIRDTHNTEGLHDTRT